MAELTPGIIAYVKRIRELVGEQKPPKNIEERRWNTERIHSVWRRPAPDDIEILNWWVGLPGREVPIRLYRKTGTVNPPVVLHFHGGGFVASSYDTHDSINWGLAAATNALVISVNYRRAPENPFPAAPNDCYDVLLWVSRNSEWLRADTSRLAVVGDSAGGCLATATAMMARDRGGPAISLQALVYPCLDPRMRSSSHDRADDPMLSKASMEFFWDSYLPGSRDTNDPIAAPIRAHNLSGLPPAYIVVGEQDPLRDESKTYADMLIHAGVETEFREAEGLIHSFLRARFVCNAAQAEFDRLADFIRQRLSQRLDGH